MSLETDLQLFDLQNDQTELADLKMGKHEGQGSVPPFVAVPAVGTNVPFSTITSQPNCP